MDYKQLTLALGLIAGAACEQALAQPGLDRFAVALEPSSADRAGAERRRDVAGTATERVVAAAHGLVDLLWNAAPTFGPAASNGIREASQALATARPGELDRIAGALMQAAAALRWGLSPPAGLEAQTARRILDAINELAAAERALVLTAERRGLPLPFAAGAYGHRLAEKASTRTGRLERATPSGTGVVSSEDFTSALRYELGELGGILRDVANAMQEERS